MKRAKILSASAGSGKTYQLALKYICDIIERPDRYRNILAVTFTNKATEEMKSRILREIHVLASGGKSSYLDNIKDMMGLSEQKIRECALVARNRILHDFSRFNILTIDKFFQRILRAFIKELGLDLDYNIELDTDILLERSVDNLVESISTNEDVRRWLFDFAEDRFQEGDSWDLRADLRSLGEQLFSEGGAKNMNQNISKDDLRRIVELITADAEQYEAKIMELGARGVEIMKGCGVEPENFSGKSRSFAFCFGKYAQGELYKISAKMLKACDDASEWYSKGSSAAVMEAAERLRPILADICAIYDKCVEKVNTAQLVRNNYRSFALLVDIQRYVNSICDDENIMVLSETKEILADFIDENNAPFIYEKVGNRYDHYMIDEFQDTSVREWRNMLPLLQEALSSNSHASVFIVGDIKQSIYRWRGGDWRLLNSVALEDLGTDNTELERLKKNYRSLANVVQFNNEIINQMVQLDNRFLNGHLNNAKESGKIDADTYAELYNILLKAYSDHGQEPAIESEEKGYVELCAYNKNVTDSPFIKAIESAIERGYKYRDILILVRRGSDAVKVANQLFAYKEQKFTSQNLSGFNILMADSLTLEGCDIVEFIMAVLRLAINSTNDIDRGLLNRFLNRPFDSQFDSEELAFLSRLAHLSPMEAFEEIISYYKLNERKESIAFLQAMHEQVIAFTTSRTADISLFLKWWEERGNKTNIAVEMSDDTIEIMTIHKAKGLERDVVIIPYANWNINPSPLNDPIVWAVADENSGEVASIGAFPVSYNGNMKESAFADAYYRELVMNHVDNLNLLYVALTRASKELYLYVAANLESQSSSENISSTSKLLVDGVKKVCPSPNSIIDGGVLAALQYTYGEPIKRVSSHKGHDAVEEVLLENYLSHMPTVKVHYPAKRYLDEGMTYENESMGMGLRLHSIFEKATTYEDIRTALRTLMLGGYIDEGEANALQAKIEAMLDNPVVNEWFNGSWDDVKREASIISRGDIRRPDRVMIKGGRVVVVDYKFGEKRSKNYSRQMKEYMNLLRDMECYQSIEGYVWYVSLGEVEKVE